MIIPPSWVFSLILLMIANCKLNINNVVKSKGSGVRQALVYILASPCSSCRYEQILTVDDCYVYGMSIFYVFCTLRDPIFLYEFHV